MILRVEVFRGEQVESHHQVDFAFAAPHERPTASRGERVFLRSAAKPFQAAAIVASGALDDLDAGDEMVAIVAASHSGEEKHTSLVTRLLSQIGMDESALRCGVHPPFHAETAARLGGAVSPLHHNCSGKHAGMLAVARKFGVPVASYLDADGPVQGFMRRTVAAACGLKPEEVVVATDGCGATTFAVPLGCAAGAFALLAQPRAAPDELREPLERVAAAMARHPDLIGGTGRFDTRLMEGTRSRLLAKGGAEGVQGIAARPTGSGMCLKVRDGAARAVAPATLEILRHAGWIDGKTLQSLDDLWRPAIANYSQTRVGRVEARIE
jgi:L-asparaginase II